MTSVFFPSARKASARFTVRFDLPTPPLPLVTAMMRAPSFGTGRAALGSGASRAVSVPESAAAESFLFSTSFRRLAA